MSDELHVIFGVGQVGRPLALGREIRLAGVPRWMVKGIGVLVPLVRQVDEMLYQWAEPFVVSDRRFRDRFRQPPADVDEAAAATVSWARQHHAAA